MSHCKADAHTDIQANSVAYVESHAQSYKDSHKQANHATNCQPNAHANTHAYTHSNGGSFHKTNYQANCDALHHSQSRPHPCADSHPHRVSHENAHGESHLFQADCQSVVLQALGLPYQPNNHSHNITYFQADCQALHHPICFTFHKAHQAAHRHTYKAHSKAHNSTQLQAICEPYTAADCSHCASQYTPQCQTYV